VKEEQMAPPELTPALPGGVPLSVHPRRSEDVDAPGATPRTVRAINDRVTLELLLHHGPLTRTQLAALTGLSKPTATQLLQRLAESGLIVPHGTTTGAPGPSAQLYALNGGAAHVAAFDVDEHRLTAAVADLAGTVLGEVSADVDYTNPGDPVPSVRQVLSDACRRSGLRARDVDLVVLGVPAAYDPSGDRLTFAEHVPGWAEPHTLPRLRAALRGEVVVENDVTLAAVWERAHGAARDVPAFALLWAGTGLGLAVEFNGAVYTGAAGGAGEIGYMRLGLRPTDGGPLPPTFDGLVGAEAVEVLARQHGLPPMASEAVAAARTHLAHGMPFLSELARRIAGGLAPIVAVLDPPLVVLAGPTCVPGGEVLVQLVSEELRAISPFKTRLAVSEVQGSPVLRGGLDAGLARVRRRLFADGGRADQVPAARDSR
jgi:predicted NBD/HSP70 family sugar kinase/DNA-binding transcriptional ArsR family regulator